MVIRGIGLRLDDVRAEINGERIMPAGQPRGGVLRIGGDATEALDLLTRGSVSDWSNATVADYLGQSAHPARALVDLLVGLEGWGFGADSVAIRRRSIQTKCALAVSMVGDKVVGPQDPLMGDCVGGLISAMPRHMRSLSLCELLVRLSEGVHRLPNTDVAEVALDQLLEALDQLRGRALAEELADVTLRISGKERTARIVCKREGWWSGYPMTLQEVAVEEGVTRERVRQICRKARDKLSLVSSSCYMPALDRTLHVLECSVPATVDVVQAALQAQGLIRSSFALPAISNAAEAFGRSFVFRQVESRDGTWVCHLDDDSRVEDDWAMIHSCAVRLVDSQGAVSIAQLQESLRERDQLEVEVAALREMLSATDGVEWLDLGQEWFWVANRGSTRVRLVNLVLKALCVCQALSASDLRAAVGRSRRLANVPPSDVLLALCGRLPQLRVDGDSVSTRCPLDHQVVLRGNELYAVELILQIGPVCRSEEMWQIASAEGINKVGFWLALSDSPAIVRYARSTYGLRGMAAPAVEVWDAANRRITRVDSPHVANGELDDRGAWFVVRVSETCCTSGHVRLPAELRGRFSGSFTVVSRGRQTQWSCTVHDDHVAGIARTLRMSAAEAGDLVLLVVDERAGLLHVLVGGDELALVDDGEVNDLAVVVPPQPAVGQGTMPTESTKRESVQTRQRPDSAAARSPSIDSLVDSIIAVLRGARKPMRVSEIALATSRALGRRVESRDVQVCLGRSLGGRVALVSGTEWILME